MISRARYRILFFISLLAIAIIVGVATLRPAAAEPSESAPQVTLVLDSTRILSTERAGATLGIVNSTARDIGYDPLEVVFEIRDANGQTREERMITSISMLPGTSWIAPGQHQSFTVHLPGCEVYIDPCSMQVAVNLGLRLKPSGFVPLTTNYVAYQFVADPTATYQVDGLRGNQPLITARGDARDTFPQDRALLTLRFNSAIPDDLTKIVDEVTTRYALSVGEQEIEGLVTSYELAPTAQSSAGDAEAPTDAQLNAIIGAIQSRYGDRVTIDPISFIPNYSGIDHVMASAQDAARAVAMRLALFSGAGSILNAYGLSDGGPWVQVLRRDSVYDQPTPFLPYLSFEFDPTVRGFEKSQRPGMLDVLVRTTPGFVGQNATKGPSSDLLRSAILCRFVGDDLSRLTAPSARALVSADRPEVYAIATVSREDAEKIGIDPDALAITLAAQSARALASQLGENTSWLSFIASYDDITSRLNQSLVSEGVALTVSDEARSTWHTLAAPTPSPPPTRAPKAPTMLIQTTAPPQAVAVPTPPGRFYRSPPTPAPELAPIDVPDPANLLIVSAEVTTAPLADELRISVAFDRGAHTPADLSNLHWPDPDGMRRTLMAIPGVEDVAVQESNGTMFPIGYQFVARTTEIARVAAAVNALQAQYAELNPSTNFDATVVASDCTSQLLRAQSESVDKAERDAVTRARSSEVELRRLVLAVAYPPITGDFCLPKAFSDATYRASDDSLHPPSKKTMTVQVPVRLVFRTRPIQPATPAP
jgi:hypothetical protein